VTPLRHAALLRACERNGYSSVTSVLNRNRLRGHDERRPYLTRSTIASAFRDAVAAGWFRRRYIGNILEWCPLPIVCVGFRAEDDLRVTYSNAAACFASMSTLEIERYFEFSDHALTHLAGLDPNDFRAPSQDAIARAVISWEHRRSLASSWLHALRNASRPNPIKPIMILTNP